MNLVNAMNDAADLTLPGTQCWYMTTDNVVMFAQHADKQEGRSRSPEEIMQWAYRESPRHSYFGRQWWMIRHEVKPGAYDAWPNPWTTPENQEKRK